MSAEEVVYAVIDALESLGVPYMVVGSFSSNLWGIPRSTHDADFVVELGATPASEVHRRLGPDFRLDPQMSFETVTSTYRFIIVSAKRARQLQNGSRSFLPSTSKKPTIVAMEETRRGLVKYDDPTRNLDETVPAP